jgi:tRNA A37 methylthiotransferase MiaB
MKFPKFIVENEDRLGEIELENPQFALLATDLMEMEHEQLESKGFDPLPYLSSPSLMATAQAVIQREKAEHESAQESKESEEEEAKVELAGCMANIQIKQTKKALKQATSKFGANSSKQDLNYIFGLKLDLKRLQQSKIRSVQ